MTEETIALLIKWGPLALMAVVFIWFFVIGVIRGTYKVTRRMIYVILYVAFVWLFIGKITNMILDFNVTINGIVGVRNFVVHTIESNETISDFLQYSPNLKGIIIDSPEIIINPILFLVLVLVGLPLSFPIYWIYLIIFNLIAKCVFKRRKYEVDEQGNVLRNEKGKKIKVHRKKRRLLGGLLRGVQGVVVFCIVLLPVNLINRIYNRTKASAELESGETLCSIDDSLRDFDVYCKYIDIYNETIFAKLGGEKSLDKVITDRLTTVKYNDMEVNLENELSSVASAGVLLLESGLMEILKSGAINLDTLDLSTIKFDKIDKLIEQLFSSSLISEVSEAGVKYVLREVANDKLVELFKDDDIVSKLEYKNADEIKRELKDVIAIVKFAVDKNLDDTIIDNKDDIISIVNNVNSEDIETLLNKMLSIKILNRAMPNIIEVYAKDYGVQVPETMTSELNEEVANLLARAIKFVQTLELTSLDSLTEGNIVDNLTDALFANGAIKANTKDELATLLNDLNTSYLFKNVTSEQINKLLDGKDYKVDARVLRYVDSKEAWLKELTVLEKAYGIYDEFKDSEVIDYAKVMGVLNELSGTKVLISVLPFAYDSLLPKVGIEIDSNGMPSIDFDGSEEDSSKKEFYDLWEDELLVLKNVADAAGVLKLQSLEDVNVELLNKEENVDALATVMSEVYNSKLLKEPFAIFMKDMMNEFVADFEIAFTKDELLAINTKEKWENEFNNINNIISIDFGNEDNINSTNLNKIFTSVNSMELFKTKKIDILKFAVRESNFLTSEEYNEIQWPESDATEETINAFWNNETSVLVDIVNQKDKIESLTNLSIEEMDVNEIGSLINTVMRSNILKNIVVNKVSELLVANDVKDDRDEEGQTINLKNTIANVSDWRVELASIKDMVTSIDTVMETKYVEIVGANRYNKVGNSYVLNSDGQYLEVNGVYYFIEDDYRFNKEGNEYTQNDAGLYLKISISNVFSIFETIENSQLLSNSRAGLLLKAVETINIVSVPSDVTVARLMSLEYDLYEKEKNVIIKLSESKNEFDNFASMDLDKIDTVKIGNLLDTVTSSIIFKDYVVDQIVTVFTQSDVRDDRDVGNNTTNLKASISSVKDWGKELSIIKEMLNVDAASFNQVVEGKTNVERIFDNIESSSLLVNTRANLLIKAVGLMSIDGVNTNSVTVETLKAVYNGESYYQYNREVDVFVSFAENKAAIDNLSDITSLSGEQKVMMANLLDAMELSSLLKDKYESTIDTSVASVKNNQALVDYGVAFKSAVQARDVDWNKEIDNLIIIKNNVATVSGYRDSDVITDRVNTLSIIGSTLDAVARSSFLGEMQADNIANKVVTELTKNLPDGYKVTSISKNSGETWSQAFDRVIQIPGI